MSTTHTLQLPDAVIAYDVYQPEVASERPTLVMIGQPMTASGFAALAAQIGDRTVVAYDPRGLGRSTRTDGSHANDPVLQARDVHALITELGAPVDMFASSGGAVTALALVAAHPADLRVLVAHEPPLIGVLPDAEAVRRAEAEVQRTYQERGFGAGMAAFIGLASWQGPFTDEYFAREAADPASFGMPTQDDGTRDDPLLGGVSNSVTAFEPDIAALRAAPTRIVPAAGAASGEVMTARSAAAIAEQLGTDVATFRGGHGGFLAEEWGQPGDPATFAQQLVAALD